MHRFLYTWLFALGCVLVLGMSSFPEPTLAQLDPSTFGSVQLVTSASFPAPQSDITVSLEASSIDTTGATISWFINGKEQADQKNNREITVRTGDLGVKQTIAATIARINGPTVSASINIIPASIDIILETSTYVPPFYEGRALPSTESQMRAIAIVHTGKNPPPETYSYQWELDGGPFSGGAVPGQSSIEFKLPLFGEPILSVSVFNAKGGLIGKRNISIKPQEIELYFYEENPLRGLNLRALKQNHTLIGEEVTLHGIPYFMNTDLTSDTATFEWSVDRTRVETGNSAQNAITLRHTGGSGKSYIELRAFTKTDIPQYLQDGLTILFN